MARPFAVVRFASGGLCLVFFLSACFLSACAGDPESRKIEYVASGDDYAAQEQYAEAIIEYLNAVQIDPRFGEARAKLARAYLQIGDEGNALGEFVRAADLLPDDVPLQLFASSSLLAAGQPDEARVRAEAVLRAEPENVQALILLGNALARLKDFETAIEKIEEAIALDPTGSAGYANMGALEAARGELDKAEAAFRKAAELAPLDVRVHLALAGFYWSVKRPADAEASFRRAHRIAPDDPLVNRAMAALSLVTGRTAEAEPYLRVVAEATVGPAGDLALADYYLAVGRPRDAISSLQPLRADAASTVAATRGLARAYAALGDYAKANELTEELLERAADDADALLLKAQLLSTTGDRDEALSQVKRAVLAAPESARAHFALGKLLSARGDVEGAEGAFTEVLRINPSVTAAEVELSKLHLVSGGTEESLEFAEAAVTRAPGDLDARLALVRSLIVAGELEQAGVELAPVASGNPESATVLSHQGMLAAAKKDYVGARSAYERALASAPGNAHAFAGVVSMDLANRDYATARARIDKQLEAFPDRSDLLFLAARTAAAEQDLDSAERFLRRAIESDASMLMAYGMLGELYYSQGRLDEAAAEFAALAARQARPVAALTMAGMIYMAQGNDDDARQRFEQVLGLEPGAPIAANNLAWMNAEAGENLDRALELAQIAVAAMPESAEARDTMGWVYYKRNLADLAIAQLAESTRLAPQTATYHYHLGLAYRQAQDMTKANQSFERALQLDPAFPGADDARAKLADDPAGVQN